MNLSDGGFEKIAELVARRSGIDLGPDRKYLVENRLASLLVRFSLPDFESLTLELGREPPDANLVEAVVEAMTTNESLFFRDVSPYEALCPQLIPQVMAGKEGFRDLRIWSAACSSGQEPYSIAMALMECQRTRSDFRIEIVATDISREVLGRAREGFFTDFEVRRGLSEERIHRFFSPCRGGWQIQDEIRAMVRFEQLNLIEPFDHLGSFDLAFCRNVLIYFNPETKKYVLERISAALKPEGLLVLGGTETTLGITQSFERAAEFPAAIFRKSGNR